MDAIQQFQELFRGRENMYGLMKVGQGGEKKWAKTVHEALSDKLWKQHLNGTGPGIGVSPIMEDNTCLFGAIDVDDKATDHAALEKAIEELGVPLVVARSKSGGAHIYVFFTDPIPAEALVPKLKEWANQLGVTSRDAQGNEIPVEIFPKQTNLVPSAVGNWINLPYYDHEKTERWASMAGTKASLVEFLMFAENRRIQPGQIHQVKTTLVPDEEGGLFEDGPPCLQAIHQEGVFEGFRNEFLLASSIYFALKHGDDWEDELDAYNTEFVDPPLGDIEIRTIKASINRQRNRGTYAYPKAPWLTERCSAGDNESRCGLRKYGCKSVAKAAATGEDPDDGSHIQGRVIKLTKTDNDPPTWGVLVDGKAISLTTDEWWTFKGFRRRVYERLNIVLPPVSQKDWETHVQDLTKGVVVITTPKDADTEGQFKALVEEFCEQATEIDGLDDLLDGTPVEQADEGRVIFLSPHLMNWLKRTKQFMIPPTKMFNYIANMGGGFDIVTIKDTQVEVWHIPTPKSPPPPEVKEEKEIL
jgi:hypothetical protein